MPLVSSLLTDDQHRRVMALVTPTRSVSAVVRDAVEAGLSTLEWTTPDPAADSWAPLIDTVLEGRDGVRLLDVLTLLGIPKHHAVRSHEMRVAKILRDEGWVPRRRLVDGVRAVRWYRSEWSHLNG